MLIKEGKAEIRADPGVFYNPQMELCRDISSLAVGALGGAGLSVLDGMCASGIRGIRYKLENDNIGKVTFADLDSRACRSARYNIRHNKLTGCSVKKTEITEYLWSNPFDLVEIDPFGTPVPYLVPAVRSVALSGGGALSATATDVAVLCGAHYKACLKNYQARPLDNEYCHENGIRILLGKIARTASEYNLGVSPVMALSKQHFMKVIVRLERGAERAVDSVKSLGYISHCPKCNWRETSKLVLREKCECGGGLLHAGPLWLGELHDEKALGWMVRENEKRAYRNSPAINVILEKMSCEMGLPAAYFDLHKVSETLGVSAERVEGVMGELAGMGFKACRTHFKDNSIKTDAGIKDVKKALVRASKR